MLNHLVRPRLAGCSMGHKLHPLNVKRKDMDRTKQKDKVSDRLNIQSMDQSSVYLNTEQEMTLDENRPSHANIDHVHHLSLALLAC